MLVCIIHRSALGYKLKFSEKKSVMLLVLLLFAFLLK